MPFLTILLGFSFVTLGQTYLYFQDSPTAGYYEYSWMELTSPSALERGGTDLTRFPVESTIPAQQGMNALRLHWTSALGGDWAAIAAGLNWTAKDISNTDTLCFYLYAVEGISSENLPKIFMEDINNTRTTKIPLTLYSADLIAGVWTRITMPVSQFISSSPLVDFTKIKTVGWAQNTSDNTSHTLLIDNVRVFTGSGISAPVAVPANFYAKGYDSHVYLTWKPNTEPHLGGYEIFQSADSGASFHIRCVAAKTDSIYTDFVGSQGTNLHLLYKIRAMNDESQPSAFSDSVPADTRVMSDEELLDMTQEATFRYFWDNADPNSGLARERNTSGTTVTTGGSGFGVMAILVGIERGFITREQGVQRMLKILNFLQNADRFHGVWPHWIDGNTGHVIPFSPKDNGGDIVETSFMIEGLLTARNYFNQNTPDEQQIVQKITGLWEAVEWDWYTRNNSGFIYWHWSPNYAWQMNMPIYGYMEAMIVYILAIASPTHPVPPAYWTSGWAASNAYHNGRTYYDIKLDVGPDKGGPLFFAHYSFLGFDPRNKKDNFTNYFSNNIHHTQINRAYCIANPHQFAGYGENCWGLTASDDPGGYQAHEPNNDNGTITPTAALSSMPYTPEYSMVALKHFYRDLGQNIWGNQGFCDAFNIGDHWYADSYLAIDQGPIIDMIENYRSQLLWNNFMANAEIQPALDSIGFVYDPEGIEEPVINNSSAIMVYPNPASSLTTVKFYLPAKEKINLSVYDQFGRMVVRIYQNVNVEPGLHEVEIPVDKIPAGLYILRLESAMLDGSCKLLISE
jgi:hypothetical protein